MAISHSLGRGRHGRRRERRWTVIARVLAALAAFLLASALMIAGSRAVFTDTTSNIGNSLAAGTVELVDDDLGSAMFNVSVMLPGDTEVECIQVTYQGTAPDPAAVLIYSGGYVDSDDFGDYLNLTVEEGAPGLFGNCTGFVPDAGPSAFSGTLTAFNATHTNYATGAGVWDPASTPESKSYRFTFNLDSATPDAEQGESATALIFTWEVQSN